MDDWEYWLTLALESWTERKSCEPRPWYEGGIQLARSIEQLVYESTLFIQCGLFT